MANPNVLVMTEYYGKTATLVLSTTSATSIVSNPSGSGKLIKIVTLMIGNTDVTIPYKLTADIYDGTTAVRFAPTISIPQNSSLDLISKTIYLQEGQSLRLTADTASKLEAIACYDELS